MPSLNPPQAPGVIKAGDKGKKQSKPAPKVLSPEQLRKKSQKTLEQICKKCVSAVKKTVHTQKNEPYTTYSHPIESQQEGLDLLKVAPGDIAKMPEDGTDCFAGEEDKNKSGPRAKKFSLDQEMIADWWGYNVVQNVKTKGVKVLCFAGQNPGPMKFDAVMIGMGISVDSKKITFKIQSQLS
ncbi:unnamed protein product [Amoebophrya sp. A120]|nr:unnamed protein product [Amoebophrya sp. A120]|eukprot:GSA120T00009585001.1